MSDNKLPELGKKSFICPHCMVHSRQEWSYYYISGGLASVNLVSVIDGSKKKSGKYLSYSRCDNCTEYMIWLNSNLIYPHETIAPLPAKDMPVELIDDYNEARDVFEKSPRASAALLRLVIQKLCVILGEKGKNINDDIKSLVSKGLPDKIQKALDVVRVIGNNAVHPGTIDLNDKPEIAFALFNLLNIIVETMITQPKEIDDLYCNLPQGQLDAIKKRDSN